MDRLQARIDELERASQVLQLVLAAVPAGVVHVDATGQIFTANEPACQFLGFSQDAMTKRFTVDWQGKTYFEDGSECAVADYPVSKCLMTGQPQPATTIGVEQRDGSIRWAVFTAAPLPSGGVPGAVVTFVDITDRMAQEQARRSLQERLQLSDRLASIGALAAGIGHEINNPLTYVIANLERIEATLGEAHEMTPAVQSATEGAQRVARIVADLGRFTRIPRGESGPFDVAEAVQAAIAMSRAEFRHRAEVRFEADDVPLALGHGDHAVQVFLNLLVNAAQAIEPGNASSNSVTVRLTMRDGRIALAFIDTGAGMSPQTLKLADQAFFTTKAPGDGTGLGLAISRELLSAMGGDLELSSEVGMGTTATVWLEPSPDVRADDPPTSDSVDTGKRARVLVVDDEPKILQMIAWILSAHELTLVDSGAEATALCETNDYDVILCDLMMPDVTGIDVHAALAKRRPKLAERLVFMTGGAFTPAASAFLEAVDARVLYKPFGAKELQALVLERASAG